MSKLGLTNHSYYDIRNTNLFKYSPYNTLTDEQNEVCVKVLTDIVEKLSKGEEGTSIISGEAGTGKTIVLVNMIYKLASATQFNVDFSDEEDEVFNENEKVIHDIRTLIKKKRRELKIGYVVPMTSIRKTLRAVFRETGGRLKANMVIGPFDVLKDDYDVIFVDEAHRLSRYKSIGYRGQFKNNAISCGLNPETSTQLDMIFKKCKYRVLVYDKAQTVKSCDITDSQFNKIARSGNYQDYELTTQMRCDGGGKYTDYISQIFNCSQKDFNEMVNYDFQLFDDVDVMINKIKNLDKKYGLCRNAAGYSWEWISKKIKDYNDVIAQGKEDIVIGDYKYVWNKSNSEFILSPNAVNEIGCIHTMQGYDLNYVGVILGYEIDYDPIKKTIVVDLSKFYDKYVKVGETKDQVRQYIINSYKVILSRGIKGCYVYACNENLRKYLKDYIKTYLGE